VSLDEIADDGASRIEAFVARRSRGLVRSGGSGI